MKTSALNGLLGAALVTLTVATVFGAPPKKGAPPKRNLTDFSYRVKVPTLSGLDCTQNAAALAERFAKATSPMTESVNGVCQGRQTIPAKSGDYTVDIIIVNYRAESEMSPYAANIKGTVFFKESETFSEPFASYNACLAELPNQVAAFNAQTGLNAVSAYCSASSFNSNDGFTLTVESFGAPCSRLYSAQTESSNAGDFAIYAKYLANAVVRLGGVIAYEDAYRVYYYAGQMLPLHVDSFSVYSNPMCEDQKAVAGQILTAAGRENISVLCATDSYGLLSLTAVSTGGHPIRSDMGYRSPQYATYQECQMDRERVLSKVKAQRSDVLGGLCTENEMGMNQFALVLYTLTQ